MATEFEIKEPLMQQHSQLFAPSLSPLMVFLTTIPNTGSSRTYTIPNTDKVLAIPLNTPETVLEIASQIPDKAELIPFPNAYAVLK